MTESLPPKLLRMAILREQMETDPQEPFSFYAYGLELDQTQVETSRFWESVLAKFPDYLPSYYQAAGCFLELDETDRALEILKIGIDLAEKKQDIHALAELKSRYQNALIG